MAESHRKTYEELDPARERLRSRIAERRKATGDTYQTLGKELRDPGCAQLQSFLKGSRGLTLALAARVSIHLGIPMSVLLTRDQKRVVREIVKATKVAA